MRGALPRRRAPVCVAMMKTTEALGRAGSSSHWVAVHQPNPRAALRLFCLPNAGSGSMIFRPWVKLLPQEYEVCAVRLPGRETRLLEPAYKRMEPLVEALVPGLLPFLDRPFALFGHSMGGKLAFEVARRLRAEYGLEPVHLFVSGTRGPRLPRKDRVLYDLPEAEFIEELRRLNGTPQEVLEHAELMSLMLPLLRADFELVQTYTYRPGPPLGCPLTACGGLRDADVTREHLAAWRHETTGPFTLRMFEGDHFFIHGERPQLLRLVAQELRASLGPRL